MLRLLLVLTVVVLSTVGCAKQSTAPAVEGLSEWTDLKAICLDGVEYWVFRNKNQAFTVRIDPTTLQPKRCR